MQDITIIKYVLDMAQISLPTEIPLEVERHLEFGKSMVQRLEQMIGNKGHGDYFESSKRRYEHCFACAMNLEKQGRVLDLGSAPGHIGMGLHLLGMEVHSVNLNEHWRETYASAEWLDKLNVIECNVERHQLPFEDGSFDGIFFTEVLEHIAITDPLRVMEEIRRVLKDDGLLIFSTPNVCNISNIYALSQGLNIFWSPAIFYGGLDRHNREYTPDEVVSLLKATGFNNLKIYGFNCDSNWRTGSSEFVYELLASIGDKHPLLRNTIMVLARK